MDMVRIIGRLEKENEYLDMLRTYAFRTALLLRDLGFQLPAEKNVDPDPLAETMLDYYAITVHGIKEGSDSIGAVETAKKAEELESAARREDLAFLTEHTPVFLEYMEYFIVGVVKLTEEKNIVNDRRLHSKRRTSDLSRRFGKQRRNKSD
jgi:HPt (histidine-containing phosphotransfer) domain-containing protein